MNFMYFLEGAVDGFSLAAPIGPVGILCVRRTLEHGARYGLVIGVSAASCDTVTHRRGFRDDACVRLHYPQTLPRFALLVGSSCWDWIRAFAPVGSRIRAVRCGLAMGLFSPRPACVYSPDGLTALCHWSQEHRRPSGLWCDARCRRLFRFPDLVCPASGLVRFSAMVMRVRLTL